MPMLIKTSCQRFLKALIVHDAFVSDSFCINQFLWFISCSSVLFLFWSFLSSYLSFPHLPAFLANAHVVTFHLKLLFVYFVEPLFIYYDFFFFFFLRGSWGANLFPVWTSFFFSLFLSFCLLPHLTSCMCMPHMNAWLTWHSPSRTWSTPLSVLSSRPRRRDPRNSSSRVFFNEASPVPSSQVHKVRPPCGTPRPLSQIKIPLP